VAWLKANERNPSCAFKTIEPLAKLLSGYESCQGTTSVVPQMANFSIPALAAAVLQITENKPSKG
jgi:hypothetical protein